MNKYLKSLIGAATGAIAGYVYFYFYGCNGTCAITSSGFISSLYGALAGFIAFFPFKKKNLIKSK